MGKTTAQKHAEALRTLERIIEVVLLRDSIRFHAHLYYNLDQPIISDAMYDQLYKKLQGIEKAHPEMITPASPTQLVGQGISAPLKERGLE